MKFKIWSILVVFILVLIISSTGLFAQEFRGSGVDWLTEKVPNPYTLDELKREFTTRNLKLATHYSKKRFQAIGAYYGPAGWIRTHENNIVIGKRDIADYFEALSKNVELVIFKSVVIDIGVNTNLYNKPSGSPGNDPVYPITENIQIIFDMENHSTVELDSSTSYYHSRRTFR